MTAGIRMRFGLGRAGAQVLPPPLRLWRTAGALNAGAAH
jgi:hypothetical protein